MTGSAVVATRRRPGESGEQRSAQFARYVVADRRAGPAEAPFTSRSIRAISSGPMRGDDRRPAEQPRVCLGPGATRRGQRLTLTGGNTPACARVLSKSDTRWSRSSGKWFPPERALSIEDGDRICTGSIAWSLTRQVGWPSRLASRMEAKRPLICRNDFDRTLPHVRGRPHGAWRPWR
jgi:hypothetical protein